MSRGALLPLGPDENEERAVEHAEMPPNVNAVTGASIGAPSTAAGHQLAGLILFLTLESS